MAEQSEAAESVAQRLRIALEAADPSAFGDLLDPNVRWGPPGDPSPPCQNRAQVLSWYRRGREAGGPSPGVRSRRARRSDDSRRDERARNALALFGADSLTEAGTGLVLAGENAFPNWHIDVCRFTC
jgi:hypothetical protein